MRVAGKELAWWWVAAAVVLTVAVGAAAMALNQSEQRLSTSLPNAEQRPGVSASSTVEPVDNMVGEKSGASPEATSPIGGATSGGGQDAAANGNGPRNSDDPQGDGESQPVKKGYVVIKFWNDTAAQPPMNVVIAADGASWKPDPSERSDVGRLGPITLNKQIALVVYSDGPRGHAVRVPIRLTDVMDSNDVDAIHVEVSDDRLRILGNPVVDVEVMASRR